MKKNKTIQRRNTLTKVLTPNLGFPTTVGMTSVGWSSPASPALIVPDPLSTTITSDISDIVNTKDSGTRHEVENIIY